MGAELVVIGHGSPEQAGWFADEQSGRVTVVTDPDGAAYRAIGARRGLRSSLGARTILAFLRAWRRGFRSSAVKGDPLQQGAVWVVRPGGEVVWRFTSEWAGDHPDPDDVVQAVRNATGAPVPASAATGGAP